MIDFHVTSARYFKKLGFSSAFLAFDLQFKITKVTIIHIFHLQLCKTQLSILRLIPNIYLYLSDLLFLLVSLPKGKFSNLTHSKKLVQYKYYFYFVYLNNTISIMTNILGTTCSKWNILYFLITRLDSLI